MFRSHNYPRHRGSYGRESKCRTPLTDRLETGHRIVEGLLGFAGPGVVEDDLLWATSWVSVGKRRGSVPAQLGPQGNLGINTLGRHRGHEPRSVRGATRPESSSPGADHRLALGTEAT